MDAEKVCPSGNRLAFASNRDGDFDVYLMKRDGSHVTRLTDHPAFDGDPSWGIARGSDYD